MKRVVLLLWPLLALPVIGLNCPARTAEEGPAELRRFKSAAELKSYMADRLRDQRIPFRYLLFFPLMMGANAPSPDTADAPTEGGNDSDFSGTNLQEAGVDESDIVKTDGTHIYVLRGERLRVIKAVPADAMAEVGSLDLGAAGSAMYLGDGRAVVLTSTYTGSWYGGGVTVSGAGSVAGVESASDEWLPDGRPSFEVNLLSLEDPTRPSLMRQYSIEGSLINSRMIGSKLFLVTAMTPDLPAQPFLVETMEVGDLLPKMKKAVGGKESIEPLVGWEDVWRPANPDGYTVITVVTLDVADPDAEPVGSSVVADWGVIYASTEALYITNTDYTASGDLREGTEVHKFDLSGGTAQYVASGLLPGRLLNQFSLGEKDGFLRAATTTGFSWADGPNKSQNHVVVLEQVGDELQTAGRIDGIAEGEELYAARFVGDRGFLVTFKKIDPLFTVDLSNPRGPKLVGELKVPGYSDYIHLLDENHLLTIGKDADDQGEFAWFGGLALSIFDVTDFANPTLLHKEILGVRGTESDALYNHKAFTLHNGLLALPVDLYEGSAEPPMYGTYTFAGVYVWRVSVENGFEPLGRISAIADDASLYDDYWWSGGRWKRGLFIGDHVYALSADLVRSAAVADVTTPLATVEFED